MKIIFKKLAQILGFSSKEEPTIKVIPTDANIVSILNQESESIYGIFDKALNKLNKVNARITKSQISKEEKVSKLQKDLDSLKLIKERNARVAKNIQNLVS